MDSPNIYPLTTVAKQRKKRSSGFTIVLIYLIPVLVILYLTYRWKYVTYTDIVSIVALVFSVMGMIRDIKKSNRKIDDVRLEIGKEIIRLTRIDKHDLVINVADIRSINAYDGGITLVTDDHEAEPFDIGNDFHNFDQVKAELEGLIIKGDQQKSPLPGEI